MPELPEVEIIKNDLLLKIKNNFINNVFYSDIKLRKKIPNLNNLVNNEIIDIQRKNKYLLFIFNNYYLIVHLGMTGQLIISETINNLNHVHCYLKFDNFYLIYRDVRRFGLIDIIPKNTDLNSISYFKNFGIEPFDINFTSDYLFNIIKKSKNNIKSFLMDSKNICGIGNIYACEILFYSKISPFRICNSLTYNEVNLLHLNIIEILKKSISLGGSTISDFIHTNGVKGTMQNYYYVYSKKNNNCKICNTLISSVKQNGRTTYYCPTCQI